MHPRSNAKTCGILSEPSTFAYSRFLFKSKQKSNIPPNNNNNNNDNNNNNSLYFQRVTHLAKKS